MKLLLPAVPALPSEAAGRRRPRGGKTISAHWDDVANVEHSVTTLRYDFIILIYRTHTYRISLANGERVKLTSSFSKHRQLGETCQRMWAGGVVARRAR